MKNYEFGSPNKPQKCRESLQLGFKEGIVPALMQFGILILAILEFVFIIGKRENAPMAQPPRKRGDDITDPSLIRLVYMFTALVTSCILACTAERKSRNGSDAAAFWLGSVGGTLLWQAVGECAWHFDVNTNGESKAFPRIDHAEGGPVFAAALILLAYAAKKQSFGFGTWTFFLNFMLIWLDHFAAFASYPLVADRHTENEWIQRCGLYLGIPSALTSLYMIFHGAKTKKGRLMSSLLLYSSMSLLIQAGGAYKKDVPR